MSGGIYMIDDISPIVFDLGSYSFRAGYGGQETPYFDVPSHVGVREVIERTIDETVDGGKPRKEYFIDTNMINVPRENTEIVSYLKNGMIEDWDIFEQMWDYIITRCLGCDTKEHPMLFSEPPWNQRDKREKIMELAFEKYNMPASYLMKNAVLALFSGGRSSGLVLDSGATHTSAIPIHDGYVLTPSVVTQPIGGDTIVEQCKHALEKQNIEIVPNYKIAHKHEVNENQKPKWTKKTNLPEVSESFEDFAVKRVVEDFAHSTLQLCDTPIDPDFMDKLPAASYAFPCGLRKDILSERAKVPEGLFDLKYLRGENVKQQYQMNVTDIAATACGMCDNEIRTQMYSNVYVVGGNSLIMGFPERLNHELALRCPASVKLRVTWAPPPVERRFGAWIGGSIVSCQPSFYQYWVTKADYDETGKSIVEKRCA
uniref:Actin-like protein 6A n=1 Tax=Panagrolaimus davidi TaxID=227884 RepID=A0A914Q3V6_9BILA